MLGQLQRSPDLASTFRSIEQHGALEGAEPCEAPAPQHPTPDVDHSLKSQGSQDNFRTGADLACTAIHDHHACSQCMNKHEQRLTLFCMPVRAGERSSMRQLQQQCNAP